VRCPQKRPSSSRGRLRAILRRILSCSIASGPASCVIAGLVWAVSTGRTALPMTWLRRSASRFSRHCRACGIRVACSRRSFSAWPLVRSQTPSEQPFEAGRARRSARSPNAPNSCLSQLPGRGSERWPAARGMARGIRPGLIDGTAACLRPGPSEGYDCPSQARISRWSSPKIPSTRAASPDRGSGDDPGVRSGLSPPRPPRRRSRAYATRTVGRLHDEVAAIRDRLFGVLSGRTPDKASPRDPWTVDASGTPAAGLRPRLRGLAPPLLPLPAGSQPSAWESGYTA